MDLSAFFERVEASGADDGPAELAKKAAADAALALVEPGMRLGLGTGSTVEFFLQGLASRIKDGLQISGVPTSRTTEKRATELGIPLLGAPDYAELSTDLCVDGADRVDLGGALVKGGGGALFREKMVAGYSRRVCILVDPSKLRRVFDDSFAVPVECLPFGIENTVGALEGLGCRASLRVQDGQPYLTDNGNLIVDCEFAQIPDPVATALRMSALVGVIEVGLFCNLLDYLVVGYSDGRVEEWAR